MKFRLKGCIENCRMSYPLKNKKWGARREMNIKHTSKFQVQLLYKLYFKCLNRHIIQVVGRNIFTPIFKYTLNKYLINTHYRTDHHKIYTLDTVWLHPNIYIKMIHSSQFDIRH